MVTDGTTLLGSDDKAGVAILMSIVARLMEKNAVPHGEVEMIFTSDEETGAGMDYFPVKQLRSRCCYTIDGGVKGEIEAECFNAATVEVDFIGVPYHLGAARGKMVNSVSMAVSFIGALPRNESPEATDGRYGYYCAEEIRGASAHTHVVFYLRDFDLNALKRRVAVLQNLANTTEMLFPGGKVTVSEKYIYYNMYEAIKKVPDVMKAIHAAGERLGLPLQEHIIRGGTDAHDWLSGNPRSEYFHWRPQSPQPIRMGGSSCDGGFRLAGGADNQILGRGFRLMPIRRTLRFLLALCFCGSVLPAGALPIRLEITSAQISSGDAQVDTTLYKAVEIGLIDVLDWRFIIDDKSDTVFEAIIENPVSDTRLFPGQRYLSFGLRLKWNGMEIEQRFAILGKSLKELETKISQAVRDQLRYDLLAVVVPPSSVWTLQYIDGSDFSLLADPGTTKIGDRHILTDYHGKVIGLASVADIFPIEDHESEHAIEFNLIQADRRPEPGMLVIPKTSSGIILWVRFLTVDFGVDVEANAPLASNNAFFSLKRSMVASQFSHSRCNGIALRLYRRSDGFATHNRTADRCSTGGRT